MLSYKRKQNLTSTSGDSITVAVDASGDVQGPQKFMAIDDAVADIANTAERDGWAVMIVDVPDAAYRLRVEREFADHFGMRTFWMPTDDSTTYPRTAEVVVLSSSAFALGHNESTRETFISTVLASVRRHAGNEGIPVDIMRTAIKETNKELAKKRKEEDGEKKEDTKTVTRRKTRRTKPRK